MMKIGIFGGSFDPIHKGHLKLSKCAIRQLKLDFLFFVPAFLPPNKFRKLSNAFHRKKMLQLSIKNSKKFLVSDFELKSKKMVYTYQTLRYFHKKYPTAELFFIMGSDSVNDLKNWKNVSGILQVSKIVFIQRGDYKVKIKKKFIKLKGVITNISSTDIREKINGRISIKGLVQKTVESYIKKNGLYNN
ncbi:MAG: nicotinate-nucleotide adenylyltransferase [Elusimicrobiota bacterium]